MRGPPHATQINNDKHAYATNPIMKMELLVVSTLVAIHPVITISTFWGFFQYYTTKISILVPKQHIYSIKYGYTWVINSPERLDSHTKN